MVLKFIEDQKTLLIGKVIVKPAEKHKKLIFYPEYQHQVQAHPYYPGEPAAKMQFWFWNINYCKIFTDSCHGAFVLIFIFIELSFTILYLQHVSCKQFCLLDRSCCNLWMTVRVIGCFHICEVPDRIYILGPDHTV